MHIIYIYVYIYIYIYYAHAIYGRVRGADSTENLVPKKPQVATLVLCSAGSNKYYSAREECTIVGAYIHHLRSHMLYTILCGHICTRLGYVAVHAHGCFIVLPQWDIKSPALHLDLILSFKYLTNHSLSNLSIATGRILTTDNFLLDMLGDWSTDLLLYGNWTFIALPARLLHPISKGHRQIKMLI